jgi:hypothetical protein
MPTPNNHLAASPHRCVRVATVRDVQDACGAPTVAAGTVSATSIQTHWRAAALSAPNDHLAAGPNRPMTVSRRGRIAKISR